MEEARKLTEERDRFIEYFDEHRKCACAVGSCKHLNRAIMKVFRDRMEEQFMSRIYIGFRAYYDAFEENERL